MTMNLKPTLLGLACLATAISTAQTGISVVVDGEPVTFAGVGPMRSKGRVMVPLRGVLEKIGASVDYDAASQTIKAERGDKRIELTIGKAFGRINDEDVPM